MSMESREIAKIIGQKVSREIIQLKESTNEGRVSAILAQLRHAVGQEPGSSPSVWEITLADLPEEIYGHRYAPSKAENAIHGALTLFAWHQQGASVHDQCMHTDTQTFAAGGAKLIKSQQDFDRIKRRFDMCVTANNFTALMQHLRTLITLLRHDKIAFNYPQLALDLYFFQMNSQRNNVRLRWGEQFYATFQKMITKEDTTNE